MESWKSGSQMTKIIDLRHWAHRRDIIPRCRDRTFSALEGSVPMKTHRCEFWFLIKGPGTTSTGTSRVHGAKGL
jgi:hypothetical protein